ncbi:MAG TPA: COX15/CtaA family protein [Vicinamibacterales bacterium]|nr:COX15/CtaA family protein [Vicinamibacterales bacterium]
MDRRLRRLRIWFWTLAAVTLAVLVVGGVTRLTRSGLSIVEWQPVAGVLPPLDHEHWVAAFERYQQFPEYQQLRRGMTLPEFQRIFLWEYAHRLLARLVGVVFLVPFLIFWRAGYFTSSLARRASEGVKYPARQKSRKGTRKMTPTRRASSRCAYSQRKMRWNSGSVMPRRSCWYSGNC